MCLQDDAYERDSPGGRVTSRFGERVLVGYG
jgi:hypothetical protein